MPETCHRRVPLPPLSTSFKSASFVLAIIALAFAAGCGKGKQRRRHRPRWKLAGRASYFEVLDAQLQLYPEQNALAQTELNRRLVIVQLYLALGGGWNLSDSDWQKHTVTLPTTANPSTSHP